MSALSIGKDSQIFDTLHLRPLGMRVSGVPTPSAMSWSFSSQVDLGSQGSCSRIAVQRRTPSACDPLDSHLGKSTEVLRVRG